MKNRIFILVCFAWLLAGCGVDPRDLADAEGIRLQADQDSLDRAQERDQAQGRYLLELAENEQTNAARTKAKNTVITAAGIAGAAAVVLAIVGAGAGLAIGAIETGRAAGRAAIVRANLIPLDRETRQFPLVICYMGKGRFSLTDPNTGASMQLDTRNQADRQLIATAGAVRLAGVVATAAAKSDDAAGLALYQPIVIGAEVAK